MVQTFRALDWCFLQALTARKVFRRLRSIINTNFFAVARTSAFQSSTAKKSSALVQVAIRLQVTTLLRRSAFSVAVIAMPTTAKARVASEALTGLGCELVESDKTRSKLSVLLIVFLDVGLRCLRISSFTDYTP